MKITINDIDKEDLDIAFRDFKHALTKEAPAYRPELILFDDGQIVSQIIPWDYFGDEYIHKHIKIDAYDLCSYCLDYVQDLNMLDKWNFKRALKRYLENIDQF